MEGKPKRRWLRFSMRSFLLAVLIACVWLGMMANSAREQRQVAAWIRGIGGSVKYDYQVMPGTIAPNLNGDPYGPEWLTRMVGVDFFHDIVTINLDRTAVTDDDLVKLLKLRKLIYLDLNETGVTDEGLKHLGEIKSLTSMLWLQQTRITDGGLHHLTGLTNLRCLDIEKTNVSRDGAIEFNRKVPGMRVMLEGPGKVLTE